MPGGVVAGCNFLSLPRELRDLVYRTLLVSSRPSKSTFGKGSGIHLSILRSCRSVHDEAKETLYGTIHKVTMISGIDRLLYGKISTVVPPICALLQLRHVHLELTFSSVNRGECEVGIVNAGRWKDILLPFGLALLRGRCISSLEIALLNTNQRKVGAKRIRSDQMLAEVRELLLLFAYLPRIVTITIVGFDTLEYAIMFEDLRADCAGAEIPVEDWATKALLL